MGKKLLMSLAGLFLIVYLIVHLAINLLVLRNDPEAFNRAAHFMATNPVIRVMEVILFGGFLVHMVYGVMVSLQNWFARPVSYSKSNNSQTSFFSKYMFHTAVIVTIFLVLHLLDFYIKAKILGDVPDITYSDGTTLHNLGELVITRFQIGWVVIVYLVALLGLGFHLHHGFQSAFQTLGLNHPVYTPLIKALGMIYTIVITAGFISIPIIVYYFK